MFSKTFTLFLNWISKVRKQENTLVTEIEKGRSYGSQKTMMISIKIVLINAVIVHVHWNTKFQLFMKKKEGLVRQILKETENHDSQDTHVRFF